MARRLLITGATGKQGGALITALTTDSSISNPLFEIYAVTRNATSPSAKRLAAKPNVTVIQANLSDPTSLFAQLPTPIWGIFAVPMMTAGHVQEEFQGKALTAAAVAAGVQHIVFTSTDRGGQIASERNSTRVPHFASKFRIEEDIKASAAAVVGKKDGSSLTYTFLRPVAFFDNLSNDFFGRCFPAMWRLNGANRPLQFIATSDIGRVAAAAFAAHDSPEYKNKAISLAGDSLSLNEATEIFREETGLRGGLPETYAWLGGAIRFAVADLRAMFGWFSESGFGVDVPDLRRRYPYLKDFRSWVREESAWKKEMREG
jgi:uncharacterized protein YbjT (DUF2867 family)